MAIFAFSQSELLDRIFRDRSTKQGLKFFVKGERAKIKLRLREGEKIEIHCAKEDAGQACDSASLDCVPRLKD